MKRYGLLTTTYNTQKSRYNLYKGAIGLVVDRMIKHNCHKPQHLIKKL